MITLISYKLIFLQTKRKGGFGEEAAKIANNILNRSSASPGPKKGGKEKEDKKEKDVKKGVGINLVITFLLWNRAKSIILLWKYGVCFFLIWNISYLTSMKCKRCTGNFLCVR